MYESFILLTINIFSIKRIFNLDQYNFLKTNFVICETFTLKREKNIKGICSFTKNIAKNLEPNIINIFVSWMCCCS